MYGHVIQHHMYPTPHSRDPPVPRLVLLSLSRDPALVHHVLLSLLVP